MSLVVPGCLAGPAVVGVQHGWQHEQPKGQCHSATVLLVPTRLEAGGSPLDALTRGTPVQRLSSGTPRQAPPPACLLARS